MRINRQTLQGVAGIAAAGLMAATTHAEVIADFDFESQQLGDSVSDISGLNSGGIKPGVTLDVSVDDTLAQSGSQSLKVVRTGDGPNPRLIFRTDQNITGNTPFQVKFSYAKAESTDLDTRVMLETTTNQNAAGIQLQNSFIRNVAGGAQISGLPALDGAGGVEGDPVWWDVTVDFTSMDDATNRIFTYDVTSDPSGTDWTPVDSSKPLADGDIKGIRFEIREPGTFWIDDVVITEIPDPSSMSLLSVGSLLLFKRRRRA